MLMLSNITQLLPPPDSLHHHHHHRTTNQSQTQQPQPQPQAQACPKPEKAQVKPLNSKTPKMPAPLLLTLLPTELLLQITTFLEKETDLNALIRSSKYLHNTLMPTLYKTCKSTNSRFLWACNNNHIQLAEAMLSRGVPLTTRVLPLAPWPRLRVEGPGPPQSIPPLSVASMKGHIEIVRLLLARDPGLINILDGFKRSALSYAIRNRHYELVRFFLGLGSSSTTTISLDAKIVLEPRRCVGSSNNTVELGTAMVSPINEALECGDLEMLMILLRDGRMRFDRGSLYAAIWGGSVDCVRACLENPGGGIDNFQVPGLSSPSPSPSRRETELVEACARGNEEIVRLILNRVEGIDANRTAARGQRTALISAARGGHENVVKILLARDEVDVEKSSKSRSTPFCWAAVKGHIGVMKLLLGTGKVDVNSRTELGRTPLACAACAGKEDVVRFLLELDDVDVDARDLSGQSPVCLAAAKGWANIVRILSETGRVDLGVNSDAGNSSMFAPLVAAV